MLSPPRHWYVYNSHQKIPYSHAALAFTGRFQVQHKIQRRQLRASHIDDHYTAAQLKYLKELAVKLNRVSSLFFMDDKAKINFGEPGHILSTGVSGKASLAPTQTTLSAEDHDVHHKGSFTPSVYLNWKVPQDASKSFCRGEVTVILNDSVLQKSCPFRHAASMIRLLQQKDQRNTLESVKCSLITIFKKMDLDMLIACRCSPGQSWINTAERVMAVSNICPSKLCIVQRNLFHRDRAKT